MEELWVKTVMVTVVVAVMVKVVVQLWWKPRKVAKHFEKQGVKGPPYQLFIGNMKEVVELMLKASSHPMPFSHNILPRVLPFYHHWKKLYGPMYIIWFGPTPRVTVSDPNQIRDIFVTNSECYEKYESHPLVRKLEGNGLISLKGELWAHRRKTISPLFHVENLKLMMPVMGKVMGHMMDEWSLKMADSGKLEIEVSECFQSLTEKVITRTIFGSSYEVGKSIFQLQTQQIIFASESFQKVSIPGYRFLPTRRNRQIGRLDKEIEESLMILINQRKQNLTVQTESNGCYPRDLLELLIQMSMNSQKRPQKTSKITEEDIVEECKSFFFAGKHTTSNLLTWTTVLLAMHPQWQQLAREEVLRVCGSRDVPTKDDLASLKTLGMIVYEALRLYPPAVATIRRTKTDVELGGIKMKKGTELLVPILAVHHDHALWGPDATEFNPARFAHGLARAARHPTAFMPFGLGARQCIGQNLALLQAKLAMAMILQRFSFDLSPNYKHAPTILMLLYPQFGAPIIFRSL